MTTADFQNAYKSLSDLQRQIVDWRGRPLLVLAGPGSGKTQVLTCRVGAILSTSPKDRFRVLALTFTNKAADEMRSRITRFVPDADRRLFCSTFHSFCADVLRQHGAHVGIQPNFTIYSEQRDLDALLSDAVDNLRKVDSSVSALDKKLLPVIGRLKSMLILPDQCIGAVPANPDLEKRLAVVYPAYEAQLGARNALDFNSLILRTHELFSRFPALAAQYRSVYTHICLDEFQDTNVAQYRLIRLLVGSEMSGLFVVADDDQIIYQWNGATHQRLTEYLDHFSAEVIQLPVNYRCPPEVVDLANSLIRKNLLRQKGKQPLLAAKPSAEGTAVRLLNDFSDEADETSAIANDIVQRHSRTLGDVCVLARSKRLLDTVQQALRALNVPAVRHQRRDDFESAEFVWLHEILRLANDRNRIDALERCCAAFREMAGINVDAEEVASISKTSQRDLFREWVDAASRLSTKQEATALVTLAKEKLVNHADFLAFARATVDWFTERSNEGQGSSGEVSAKNSPFDEDLAAWTLLFREIRDALGPDCTLEAFLQELQMRSKEAPPTVPSVQLFTIHASKGREFRHVYLIGLVEDELPSYQSRKRGGASAELEEERRNCFVAITRTGESLTLSYAKRYRGWPKEPSRFLYEMELLEES